MGNFLLARVEFNLSITQFIPNHELTKYYFSMITEEETVWERQYFCPHGHQAPSDSNTLIEQESDQGNDIRNKV